MKKYLIITLIITTILFISLCIFIYLFLRGISWEKYSDIEINYKYTIEFRMYRNLKNETPYVCIDLVNDSFENRLGGIFRVNEIKKIWIKYPDTLKVYCGYKDYANNKSSVFDTLSIYLYEYFQWFEYDTNKRVFLKTDDNYLYQNYIINQKTRDERKKSKCQMQRE